MTAIPRSRGGWWHDYVCPTHGTELGVPVEGSHPCPYGCVWTGEPFESAWLALAHQRHARQLRRSAAQAAAGDPAAADRALADLAGYARRYAELPAGHEGAREWMVPGRLFQQALSEAIWATGVAAAVWTLAEVLDPARQERLASAAVPLLSGLRRTAAAGRRATELRSNYVAWFNAAGALTSGALARLGAPATGPADWLDGPAGLSAQVRAAVLDDGWEWEGSSYYHAFVLLAYLYTLRGTDPGALPADVAERLVGMVRVLGSLLTPDGVLPALHDSPYRRPADQESLAAAHRRIEVCELAELVSLARGLVATEALAPLAEWCRTALAGSEESDLLDPPTGWFTGPPLPEPATTRGSTLFATAGYAVLRPADRQWLAVLDFGAHGGSHGHLDKLALYLYGDRVAWQPDPGMVPYGSPLRRAVYRTTRAHPAFSVDGGEQAECAGRLMHWRGDGTGVVAEVDRAYPGVLARRHLLVAAVGLLDVLELRADREAELALHLRPAVPVAVRAVAGGWRTDWGGEVPLTGWHASSVPSRLSPVPGWAPADDPTRPQRWIDWSAQTSAVVFATLWRFGHGPEAAAPGSLVVTPDAVEFRRPDRIPLRYPLHLGEQS